MEIAPINEVMSLLVLAFLSVGEVAGGAGAPPISGMVFASRLTAWPNWPAPTPGKYQPLTPTDLLFRLGSADIPPNSVSFMKGRGSARSPLEGFLPTSNTSHGGRKTAKEHWTNFTIQLRSTGWGPELRSQNTVCKWPPIRHPPIRLLAVGLRYKVCRQPP